MPNKVGFRVPGERFQSPKRRFVSKFGRWVTTEKFVIVKKINIFI
jgi:hypothetical protein